MKENLKTLSLNDGMTQQLVSDDSLWFNLTTPGYCFYNNEPGNKNTYGVLYNRHSANTGKLCPIGWHVPSDKG